MEKEHYFMGVLLNLTKEYFRDIVRVEDEKFLEDDLIPVDIGCSVLWADKDLEKKGEGSDKKYFSFEEVKDVKFKHRWRLPTFDEYSELIENKNISRRSYSKEVEFINKTTYEKLTFEHYGVFNVDMGLRGQVVNFFPENIVRLIDIDPSSASSGSGEGRVFDVRWNSKELKDALDDATMTQTRSDTKYPIRLVKDK